MDPRPIDVLQWPVVGSFLRWRHARMSLQLGLLLVATVLVVHGLFGPQIAPANLATVLSWVHYRGLLVVALLAAGNFFCTGCPFVLVRDTGRRLHGPTRRWPRLLRSKWIGIALVAGVLFSYELFDLWSLPRATAWLVIAYFGAALVVDLAFTGASFCKYLCPIGQFSFVASTMSPLELRARTLDVCHACRTADCIRGRRSEQAPAVVVQRGCELALFMPSKVGNLDCTLCLDCVQACPHDNIALTTRVPGLELVDARRRSGIGRLARRWDIAALAVLFVFGGLVNALGMVTPAAAIEQWLARATGVQSEAVVLAILFAIGLVVIPAIVLGTAGALTASVGERGRGSIVRIGVNYVYALVPFGFGVWLSHYGFHLLTGALTVIPVTQSAAIDLTGRAWLGTPWWSLTGLRPGTVFPLEVGTILLGAIGAAGLAYLVSERDYPDRPWRATLPWLAVIAGLTVAALWILSQPMDMRGVGLPG